MREREREGEEKKEAESARPPRGIRAHPSVTNARILTLGRYLASSAPPPAMLFLIASMKRIYDFPKRETIF